MASEMNTPSHGDENYSVDEMMSRLKKGEHQKRQEESAKEGELVTRDDGTQVLKVRRRKRRSQQPKKEEKKMNPKVKWLIFGSILGIGILLVVATVIIIAKYNGRTFKESTETTIAELSGANKTSVTQLRVTPVSAKANKFQLNWDQHSFLKSATFSNLRADIKATSFFTKDWIGEEVVASIGKVYFQKPISRLETGSDTIASPYNFDAYRCNQMDIHFGEERNAPAIMGLQISQRKMVNEKYQFVFQDGTLKIQNWPELQLSSGVITMNSQDAEIEALLAAGSGRNGELVVNGRISTSTQKPLILDIKAKDYPIQDLLGKDLARLIQGSTQSDMGSLSYDYKKPSASGLSFILPFNSTDIKLSGLPFLEALKDLTGNTNYVRPSFNNCRGTVMRTSDGVSINDMIWISNSLITLEGNLQVATDKKLSGTLNVGIPRSSFDGAPPQPFVGPKDGLYHAKINLSGTIHNPHDDLKEHINANAGKEILPTQTTTEQLAPLTPKEKMEEDFDALSR